MTTARKGRGGGRGTGPLAHTLPGQHCSNCGTCVSTLLSFFAGSQLSSRHVDTHTQFLRPHTYVGLRVWLIGLAHIARINTNMLKISLLIRLLGFPQLHGNAIKLVHC